MIDTDSLLASVNLETVIAADLGPHLSRSGRWLLWRCPFHDDKGPSLGAIPDNGRWHCFGCGKGGNAITWLKDREGLTFLQACERLGAGNLRPAEPRPPAPPPQPQTGPSLDQERAAEVRDICGRALWAGGGGDRALAYLQQRGIGEDIAQRWRLGYNPTDREIAGLFVPRGIVIPGEVGGTIWYLKVRRAPGQTPKYKQVAGGRPALFGAGNLAGKRVAVFVEGEFDCMLLTKYAGKLAGVVTLGSAGKRLDLPPAQLNLLLPLSPYLLAYDLDAAGAAGADALALITARARRVTVPQFSPEDKDLTDYWKRGLDLRAWLLNGFFEAGISNDPEAQ
jgi:DNA primase